MGWLENDSNRWSYTLGSRYCLVQQVGYHSLVEKEYISSDSMNIEVDWKINKR